MFASEKDKVFTLSKNIIINATSGKGRDVAGKKYGEGLHMGYHYPSSFFNPLA